MSSPSMCYVIPWIFFGFHWQIPCHACHLSLYLSDVHPHLSSIWWIASKRVGSQDTDGNAARAAVERVSSSLLIYEDTKLFLDKDIEMKCQEVNEHLQDLLKKTSNTVRCMWTFTSPACIELHANTLRSHAWTWKHWIVSQNDPKTMTLSSVNGTKLATFWERDYDEMYQMLEPMTITKTPFTLSNNSANSRDIMKSWVKEPARFRLTPNQIYKTKIL